MKITDRLIWLNIGFAYIISGHRLVNCCRNTKAQYMLIMLMIMNDDFANSTRWLELNQRDVTCQ